MRTLQGKNKIKIHIFHILFEHMLKQSGNTVDKGVFLAQIQAGEWPQVLVLKPQIQEMAQEFKHCVQRVMCH